MEGSHQRLKETIDILKNIRSYGLYCPENKQIKGLLQDINNYIYENCHVYNKKIKVDSCILKYTLAERKSGIELEFI